MGGLLEACVVLCGGGSELVVMCVLLGGESTVAGIPEIGVLLGGGGSEPALIFVLLRGGST